jgi:addiction module RelE/StbE family toxin
MDHRVTWSPEALDDVEAIAEYIERDSPAYARAVVQKILATTRKLQRFPRAGRTVPELGDDAMRELLVYSYRVIYRVRDQAVLVVAVIHGKRELAPIAERLTDDE